MTFNHFESLRQPAEPGRAARYAALVLATLWGAKALGAVPWVGPAALSGAVFLQLWLPLSRCDAWGLPWSAVGLDRARVREELWEAGRQAAVILPLYACVTAWMYTHGAAWAAHMLGPAWSHALPCARWRGPPWPGDAAAGLALVWACAKGIATHVLGVALPEEAFYRGYVQAQWQYVWPHTPGRREPGRAAVLACALFALGHFVGEWHPGRLLPFFPGLLFARQRNVRGSLVGCVALHAACNLFSAGWAACFVP